MYKKNKIAVVIPAYNEEKLILKTIKTIPPFVDKIVVVDDKSQDKTVNLVKSIEKRYKKKLILIEHEVNMGVGNAILSGYKKSFELNIDIVAVMAGDAQMDPNQLKKLLDPIVEKRADYTKGNRLISNDLKKMPKTRQRGNALLTILTKVSSGYWSIMDPQNGYTAASRDVIEVLINEKFYPRYGYCNDILVKLNIYNFRVLDVIMPPVYGDEESGIKLRSYMPKLSWLLIKSFFYRINKKYGGINFHPLILFYYFGIISSFAGFFLGLFLLYNRIVFGEYSIGTVILTSLLITVGVQLILFAMFFDSNSTRNLKPKNADNRGSFLKRIFHDYWGINFHPLFLFFFGGLIFSCVGFIMGLYVFYLRLLGNFYSTGTIVLVVLLIIMGLQFLLFSMVFDYEASQNKN